MRRFRTLLAGTCSALILLAPAGCASAGGSSRAARPDADVLTAEEIESDANLDVLTLLQRLRPRWLQARGSMSFGGQSTASVIVDGVNQGGLGYLRGIRAIEVQEIRYMSASDATTRYGVNMAGGAILVTLRR